MIFNRFFVKCIFLLFGFLSSVSSIFAEELVVKAGFESSAVVQGDVCRFVITTNQKVDLNYTLPKVNGLRFEGPIEQQWVIIQDGKQSVTNRFVYNVKADNIGEYVLSAFRIRSGAESFVVTERRLTVLEKANGRSSRDLFAEMKMDAKQVYVGQAVPFTYAVYLSFDLDERKMDPLVKINGEGFSEPDFPVNVGIAGSEIRYQKKYYVIRWPFLLTAFKAGKQEIAFQSVLYVGTQAANRNNYQNDSDLDRYTLKTEDTSVEILPLPENGKPKSFTGGIGSFSVKAEVDVKEVAVGDAITYRLIVEGEGNFSRMTIPILHLGNDWIARSKGSLFSPSDRIGFKGKRVFEYMLVPKDNGISEIPSVAFSFFIPDEAKYKEIIVPAIPIKVTGDNPGAPIDASNETMEESVAWDVFAPIHDPNLGSGTLVPFYAQKKFLWYIPVLSICVLAFIAWQYPCYRDRKRPEAVRFRALKHAIAEVSLNGKKAAEAGNDAELLRCFVLGLQHWLAFYRGCLPDSLTDEEVMDALNQSELDESCKRVANEAVTSLNRYHYGTRDISKIDIPQMLKSLELLNAALVADASEKYKPFPVLK